MTKRFENVEIDKRYCLICLNDNIQFRSLSEEGLEDLLNELNDENEQLRHDATVLIQSNRDYRKENESLRKWKKEQVEQYLRLKNVCNTVKRENEKLKSICKDHRDHAIDFKADCVRLQNENEQLKARIQSIYEIIEEYVHTHHAHSSMRMKKQIEKVMWND